MKKSILKIMLGTIILEVILVCMFILIGDFNEVSWKSLGSVGIIFAYSLPCIFYSKIYDNNEYRNVAVLGAGVVGMVAFIRIILMWDLIPNSEFLSKFLTTFEVVIWLLAFVSWLLSIISNNNLMNLFKKISMLSMMILSLFLIIIVWFGFPSGFLVRFFYMLLVLTIGSCIATLILTKIYINDVKEEAPVSNEDTDVNNSENSNDASKNDNENSQQEKIEINDINENSN